jgi:hypothetical protein
MKIWNNYIHAALAWYGYPLGGLVFWKVILGKWRGEKEVS